MLKLHKEKSNITATRIETMNICDESALSENVFSGSPGSITTSTAKIRRASKDKFNVLYVNKLGKEKGNP